MDMRSNKPAPILKSEIPDSAIAKFHSKFTQKESCECWEWIAAKGRHGYGHFSFAGKTRQSHRVAFAIYFGSVPDLLVCHKCDNPSCVNPDHLFLGTDKDNLNDSYSKRRRSVKISPEAWNRIIEQIQSGRSHREVADEFGVTHQAITYIKKAKLGKEQP